MCLRYLVLFPVAFVCCLLARICYLILVKRDEPRGESRPVKTMIILGSGGHTAEMLRVVKHLNLENYSPRVYIRAQTDKLSAEKVRDLTSIWTTVFATLNCLPILWRENPGLILCNGPGTCVPLCIIAFLFRALCITQNVIVFIESFCRVKSFSLTGKILYYLADHVIVQWAYLSKPMYSRSVLL